MIFLLVALFLLNPIIGVIVYGVFLTTIDKVDTKYFYTFYVLLALLLGFINMTKIPDSDLAFHASEYLEAKQLTLTQYLLLRSGKEVVFYTFNYWFNYLSGGSIKFWVLFMSLVSYIPFFIGVHKFQVKINPTPSYIIFSICIAAFFPQLFSISAHLLRQFIAGAILIYFLVDKLVYKNNKWWIPLLAMFIHSSSLILFLPAYVPFLREKLNKRNLKYFALLAVAMVGYQIIAQKLASLVSDSASLSYSLERASTDTTTDIGGFSIVNMVFIAILLIVVNRNIFKEKAENTIEGMVHLGNIAVILSVFVLINIRQSELSNRLFFYLCFLFPLIIPLTVRKAGYKIVRKIVGVGVIAFFVLRLNAGVWKYDSLGELISSTAFSFLNRKEFIVN